MLLKTQLNDYHVAHGKTIDFAGFEMPIWYKGITRETLAVRNQVGVFDVSHMGRLIVKGADAETYLNSVTTNDVSALKPGQGHYTLLCNEDGGIKDDIIVLRLWSDGFVVVFNAGNRKKDMEWLRAQLLQKNVDLTDVSDETALVSLQGPKALKMLQELSKADLSRVPRFGCVQTTVNGVDCLLSRTGYTGEDGFEILVWDCPLSDPRKVVSVWDSILARGEKYGIEPCGLGARDTLRLEAGMCLYGNDMDENIDPYEARLGFAVKLSKANFVGKTTLEIKKNEGLKLLRVGLRAKERGVPRPGYEISVDTKTIGRLTSGTFSPTLNCGIGMGHIPREYAAEGQVLGIMIRGRRLDSVVTKLPFYPADKFGWHRKT